MNEKNKLLMNTKPEYLKHIILRILTESNYILREVDRPETPRATDNIIITAVPEYKCVRTIQHTTRMFSPEINYKWLTNNNYILPEVDRPKAPRATDKIIITAVPEYNCVRTIQHTDRTLRPIINVSEHNVN